MLAYYFQKYLYDVISSSSKGNAIRIGDILVDKAYKNGKITAAEKKSLLGSLNQAIDTACMSSELLLAISGSQAQEESISISKNMRWSCERRMKNGTFIASSTPYGYKLQNGQLQIVESEAEIVG